MRKDVVTINSNASIKEAAKIMYEKNIGSLIIYDDDGLKGMITERDIMVSLLVRGISSDSKVKDIYSTPLVSVEPDSSILDVMETINKTHIHKIPVMKDGHLLGIISSTDLVVLFSMFEQKELEKKFGPYVGQ